MSVKNSQIYQPYFTKCKAQTMTNKKRFESLLDCIIDVNKRQISGVMVEVGVWKGGNCMAMAYTNMAMKIEREIYLFDTFKGVTEPIRGVDLGNGGKCAHTLWEKHNERWCYAPIERVLSNMKSTGYPKDKIKFIQGDISITGRSYKMKPISILRIDVDIYKPTYDTLRYFYPYLVNGGYLILDDHFHWMGAKKAANQYFREIGERLELIRVDDTDSCGYMIKKN